MTAQEMHNSVMQGVDKIHAQIADTLLAIEIDREINKAIEQFISTRFQKNNKYGMGFEESQKRRDDLRTLIQETDRSALFKEVLRDDTHAEGSLFVDTIKLPSNYRHLINISTQLMRTPDCTSLAYQLRDQDKMWFWVLNAKDFLYGGTGGVTLDEIYLVDDIDADWGTGDQQLIWSMEGAPMSVAAGTYPDPAPFGTSIYPISYQSYIDAFIGAINAQWAGSLFAYWESFYPSGNISGVDLEGFAELDSISYPGSVIIALSNATEDFPEFNFSPEGSTANLVGRWNNESVKFELVKYNENFTEHRRVPSTTEFIRERYPCRLIQHDDVFKLVDDPFNKTKYTSPLTVMRGEHIDIYTDDIFIIDTIRLTYLRQPAVVNLGNDVDCDLPLHTHEEICKLAVASILEEISDPRYQTHLSQVDRME